MPMAIAKRLCPQAIIAPPRSHAYAEASGKFQAILESFTPMVEPISIDEAFLDVRGSEKLYGPPEEIARKIKARVNEEIGLVASIGIAETKFVAKVASDFGKPNGLLVVPPSETRRFLYPLPIERLYGVGAKTAVTLKGLGLSTIGDLDRYPTDTLERRLGHWAVELQLLSHGEDPRRVEPDREAKAIGAEETFDEDLPKGDALARHILSQADRVAERLRRAGLSARTVTLKLKDPAFKIITRRRTLDAPTSDGRVLAATAKALLDEAPIGAGGVRLSGVSASGLDSASSPRQLSLDEGSRRRGEELGKTLDRIHDRFGRKSVARADLLDQNDEDE